MQSIWDLDRQIFRTIHVGWHSQFLDPIFWALSTSGLGWVQALVILLAAFLPPYGSELVATLKVRFQTWLGPLLGTIVLSGVLNTGLLKPLFARDRPSNLSWAEPQETFYRGSFPSGHASTAFGIAVMILLLTKGTSRAWAGWAALIWATLVGISRIYRGVHWPSDVLAGALVGVVGACLTYLILRPRSSD